MKIWKNIDSNLRPQRRGKGPGHRAEGEGEGPESCAGIQQSGIRAL